MSASAHARRRASGADESVHESVASAGEGVAVTAGVRGERRREL